ncbi:MAG TPA: hypothetical protein VEJ47_00085 [Candidatus Eremiobacteraceae bacterium]|nr:hypothetical protein [Candidatus Eremiobacteraceae bacterium]
MSKWLEEEVREYLRHYENPPTVSAFVACNTDKGTETDYDELVHLVYEGILLDDVGLCCTPAPTSDEQFLRLIHVAPLQGRKTSCRKPRQKRREYV